LLCGNVAVQSILGNIGGITKIRGKWFDGGDNVHGAKLMPIFHPSYLLRNDTREKGGPKWLMWQDIQEIKRVYEQL
jgi:DNA polymerase